MTEEKKKRRGKGTQTILAITAIAIIALGCLMKGLDGQIIALGMGLIAGLGGYEVYKLEKE